MKNAKIVVTIGQAIYANEADFKLMWFTANIKRYQFTTSKKPPRMVKDKNLILDFLSSDLNMVMLSFTATYLVKRLIAKSNPVAKNTR